jgi:hypothetical protein
MIHYTINISWFDAWNFGVDVFWCLILPLFCFILLFMGINARAAAHREDYIQKIAGYCLFVLAIILYLTGTHWIHM